MKVSVAKLWFQLFTCTIAKLCSVWNEMLIIDSGLRESQHTQLRLENVVLALPF